RPADPAPFDAPGDLRRATRAAVARGAAVQAEVELAQRQPDAQLGAEAGEVRGELAAPAGGELPIDPDAVPAQEEGRAVVEALGREREALDAEAVAEVVQAGRQEPRAEHERALEALHAAERV